MKQADMKQSEERIALLIDADNAPYSKIDTILTELAQFGVVNIRRAYGNWKSSNMKGWEDNLHEYAIRPIQQFDLTKGKNATDMAMIIDAMDIVYTKEIDIFCIVSSDSDFTPLVTRILDEGRKVFGFGERKTPTAFVNACSKFLYLESNGDENNMPMFQMKKSGDELKGDTKLLNLLRNAIDSTQDDHGWSYLGNVGLHIANRASFDPRNYGYRKLGDLFRAIDIFETEFRNNNSELYIRDKRKAKA